MSLILFLVGFAIGFLIAHVFSGKKEGGKPQLVLKTEKYDYRLHHWIIFSFILIILIAVGYTNSFIYGLIIGIIIQGLTYKDFYEIKTKPKK